MFEIGQLVTARNHGEYAMTDALKPLRIIEIKMGRMVIIECLWGSGMKFKLSEDSLRPMGDNELLKEGQKIRVILGGKTTLVTFVRYEDFGVEVKLPTGDFATFSTHLLRYGNIGGINV